MGLGLLLSACGGGNDVASSSTPVSTGTACDLSAQKSWLQTYLSDWYYFRSQMPVGVNPQAYTDITGYFDALLAKTDSTGKALDRWSYIQDSTSYSQFFSDGQQLGYGLFVAGQASDPLPLRIRYVAPGSAAESAGLRRGMVIDQINGKDPAALKTAGDFSALTPAASGDVLTLVVRDGLTATASRSVSVTAYAYALAPVSDVKIITSPSGRKAGYLVYKDFISTAEAPLRSALTSFQAAGVTELVLDLRYNGGGLIAAAADLASAIGGSRVAGQRFVTLTYNDSHQSSNQPFNFTTTLPTLNLARVYVLTGVRTCSASELVVNGLSPFVEVVQIGGTTCGKPFGFTPQTKCGNTFSAVNFESFNARNAGRYYDGLAPACGVNDDLDHALGDGSEALTATALRHMDGNTACPIAAVTTTNRSPLAARTRQAANLILDGDTPGGMTMRP